MARIASASTVSGRGGSTSGGSVSGGGVLLSPVLGGKGSKRSSRAKGRALVLPYVLYFSQLLAFGFLLLCLYSFNRLDWPSASVSPNNAVALNWCGRFGAVVAYHALSMLGIGTYVLMAMWGLYLFLSAFVTTISHTWVRIIGALVTAVGVSAAHSLLAPQLGAFPPSLGGGMLGTWLAAKFSDPFSTIGALFPIALIIGVGLVVAVDVWVIIVPAWAFRKVKQHAPPVIEGVSTVAETAGAAAGTAAVGGKRFFGWLGDWIGGRDEAAATAVGTTRAAKAAAGTKSKRSKDAAKEVIDEQAGGIGGTETFDPAQHTLSVGPDGQAIPTASKAKSGVTAATPPTAASKAAKAAPGTGKPTDELESDEEDELDDDSDSEVDSDESADAEDSVDGEEAAPNAKKSFTAEELRAKIAKLPVVFASKERRAATDEDLSNIQNSTNLEGYKFPGLDLLEEPDQTYPERMEQYVREQATSLERALREYKIDGEVVGIESGPVITLFEVRLAAGTKVAALSAISSDLARSLKAVNIRIVPNTQGRDTVGIEVPNLHKEKVRLKELMTRSESYTSMALPMFLGKDASGQPLIVDLAQQPHMLIAGTTGSGKSVCMSSILMSFLYTKKPNELKLVLVDPKMVELSQFRDIPHLMCPVVTEMNKAAAILEWAVGKMEERYELLADAGCRDVASYNSLTWEELKERFNPRSEQEEARIPKKLPYMVFVIDELADLMMTNKEVEHSIVRMAQKARAVGMHLIVATQRPQANVVTGLIKANMPGRISFKVASGMDSRIVLDQKGGELLLGQGDMLYLSPKTSKLMRSQGTLVDDKEIRKVVKFLRDIAAPSFETQLLQIRTGSAVASGLGGDDDDAGDLEGNHDGLLNAQSDPLFNKAVEIVLETRKGSVSMLQRRMAIGYTRASRLVDAMGQAGIVGDHKGTVERDVLITPEEWEAMKAQFEADQAAAGTAPAESATSEDLFDGGDSAPQSPAGQPNPASTRPASTPASGNILPSVHVKPSDAPFEANR